MAVSTTPQPPDQYHCPLMQVIIPAFWAGKLALTRGSMLTAAEDVPFGTHGAFNLGQIAGLHGSGKSHSSARFMGSGSDSVETDWFRQPEHC